VINRQHVRCLIDLRREYRPRRLNCFMSVFQYRNSFSAFRFHRFILSFCNGRTIPRSGTSHTYIDDTASLNLRQRPIISLQQEESEQHRHWIRRFSLYPFPASTVNAGNVEWRRLCPGSNPSGMTSGSGSCSAGLVSPYFYLDSHKTRSSFCSSSV
jgi:hypothetical protein